MAHVALKQVMSRQHGNDALTLMMMVKHAQHQQGVVVLVSLANVYVMVVVIAALTSMMMVKHAQHQHKAARVVLVL